MSELKELLSPSALPVLVILVALAVAFLRFERAKKDMIGIIADEVARRGNQAPQPVSIKQPFVVTPEDTHVRTSTCSLHMQGLHGQINAVSIRVDRLERKWDDDVKRIHDRIDEIPARVIALLGDTKNLHSEKR